MKLFLMLLLAYFIGSIPSGVWIGKIFFHKDIRQFGSGNSGTTNTYRVLGKTAGTIVLFMDILKGTLAACLPYFFHIDMNLLVAGLPAVLGHTFPIFAGFRGGKAVATSAGLLLAYNPPFFIMSAILLFSLVYITSMVSVASMTSMIIITLFSFYYHDWILTTIAFILTIFIFYRHKDNIKRIRNGTENKVHFGLAYKREQKNK